MKQEKKRHQSASVSALAIWRANAYFPEDYSGRSACIRPTPEARHMGIIQARVATRSRVKITAMYTASSSGPVSYSVERISCVIPALLPIQLPIQ
jgi:hypothetical protein